VRWPEVALRLALIASLCAAIVYNVAVWIVAPVGLMAIAATVELAVRPYGRNDVDRLLLGCGAVVTTLILAGLVLDITPWGLTRTSWTVAWTIISIGVLVWRRRLRLNIRPHAAKIGRLTPWLLAASLILIGAVALALTGVRDWNRQPVMAFALEATDAHSVLVEIDATSINESYRIEATSDVPGARRYLSAPVAVDAGGGGKRILERVPTNIEGVWTIRLESAANGVVLRWLRVNAQ
jgi:hypothetical protein